MSEERPRLERENAVLRRKLQRLESKTKLLQSLQDQNATVLRSLMDDLETERAESDRLLLAILPPTIAALQKEGERSGVLRPLRSDPLHFVSTVVGSTLFYVASLPTFVADLPYDLLCEEQLEAHKRDVLDITRRLLGIHGPRPVAEPTESNTRRRP